MPLTPLPAWSIRLVLAAVTTLAACNTGTFSGTKGAAINASGSAGEVAHLQARQTADSPPQGTAPAPQAALAKPGEPATSLDSTSLESCSSTLSTVGYHDVERRMVFRELPKTADYCGALEACAAMDPQGLFVTIGDEVADALKSCLHMINYWAFLVGESKEVWQQKYCASRHNLLYNIQLSTSKDEAKYVICAYPYRAK